MRTRDSAHSRVFRGLPTASKRHARVCPEFGAPLSPRSNEEFVASLLAAFVLTPSAFREGMKIWVDYETAQSMHRMQPIIEDLMTPPDPTNN
ncbi:hypothetical protein NOCA2150120 [metagenome]|uniref:Uncharacterized protein n=1 Tax=metagenome TaxID=256318 RepID=A0A2P2BX98_9ZZZZ